MIYNVYLNSEMLSILELVTYLFKIIIVYLLCWSARARTASGAVTIKCVKSRREEAEATPLKCLFSEKLHLPAVT